MTALSANLVVAKDLYPDRIALRCDDLTFTFAEFHTAAARVATLLERAGIEPGDRVGLMLPNTPAYAIAFFGIMYRGAVAVPMNPLLKAREVTYYLSNSGATALFATPSFAAEATAGADEVGARCWLVDDAALAGLIADLPVRQNPVQRGSDDVAVIVHTSGTTGKPKGAMLTHGNLGCNAEVTVRTLAKITPDDVVMGCLPLFHVFGLTGALNSAVLAGATLTLIPRFDPRKALEVIERDAVTVFEGVPTMYSALLGAAESAPGATRSLRTCVSGGAALPVQVLTDFEKAFGCTVLEGYGLSESSSAAAFNHPDRPRKAGSIGTPIDGVQMRVVDLNGAEVARGDTGEIQIRGHNVMKGYWNLPDATRATITEDGWLNTGDVGRVDEDGYFYIVDRTKDLIIRGGYNVYPREIEEVLYEHPAVAEAAVVGVPHDSLGEEVGAAVALKKDATVTAEQLRDHVKDRVAAYKYPRMVWLVDELPKGPTGKVQKRDITIPTTERTR
ncbi:long-chain-fatty-acid--CoA ligase [Mycobacterium paragordonae]|uniref:Long-chain-fatty-acid--CoA ligase FadD13 n=1 Tax=Mycobacterium paragordonae TaxID=1389713 RepID=A0A4R5WNK1_9MYCO|nr:long-chain fatty acid--CoA ligase [Mycobacterium paragordonae]MDP7736542.1 long-chain fatty acid--CoA ligase [Mycobacterium paragordonae]TDK92853.1 long-chain fatty acid--CoA ligase [Mycobacterium paragordonae]TDL04716.1 long-chain fatty acid--CoA ligase [Mycobacterium paragordonae]